MSLFDRTHPTSSFSDDDYESFEATVVCPSNHETRRVTIHHPSDTHYCTKCGQRMPGMLTFANRTGKIEP